MMYAIARDRRHREVFLNVDTMQWTYDLRSASLYHSWYIARCVAAVFDGAGVVTIVHKEVPL